MGLQRQAGVDRFDTLSALRRAAVKQPEFRTEALDSMESCEQCYPQPVKSSVPAEDEEMFHLWDALSCILSNVPPPDLLHKKSDLTILSRFLDHCTRIKKCNQSTCGLCRAVRLPQEVLNQLKPFPDPMPGLMSTTYLLIMPMVLIPVKSTGHQLARSLPSSAPFHPMGSFSM